MAVSGTNQSKSVVTPYGARKAGVYMWGDPDATWGDPIATWGGSMIVPANQSKSGGATSFLVTDEGDFLVTDEGDFICTVIGGSVVNQSKS